MKRFVSISILLVMGYVLVAQNYEYEKITDKMEYIMLLDSKERLWFSNKENIVMYDGELHVQNVVPLKFENKLWEDSKGNIWGTCISGFICYDNKEWKEYRYDNNLFTGTAIKLALNDEQGRIFFVNVKTDGNNLETEKYVAIFENDRFIYLTDNLPKKINEMCQFKGGVIFGDKYNNGKKKPCGYYSNAYEYLTEGYIFDFFNSIPNRKLSKDYYLGDTEKFKKYTIRYVEAFNEGLLILTNDLVVFYNINDKSIKEYKIANEYQDIITKSESFSLYKIDDKIYIVFSNDGVLEVSDNNMYYSEKNKGLSDNQISFSFIDNNNLVLLHPKSSSVLINGKWVFFDKSSGYDLNKLPVTNIFDIENKKYLTGINFMNGSPSRLLQWDGSSWKTTKFTCIGNMDNLPFIFNNNIWFVSYYQEKNQGLSYFEGETPKFYPMGEKLFGQYPGNRVYSVSHSEKSIYVNTSTTKGFVLYKIWIKK